MANSIQQNKTGLAKYLSAEDEALSFVQSPVKQDAEGADGFTEEELLAQGAVVVDPGADEGLTEEELLAQGARPAEDSLAWADVDTDADLEWGEFWDTMGARAKASLAVDVPGEFRAYENSFGKGNVRRVVDNEGDDRFVRMQDGKPVLIDPDGFDVGDVTADWFGPAFEFGGGLVTSGVAGLTMGPVAVGLGTAGGNVARQGLSMYLGNQDDIQWDETLYAGAMGGLGEKVGRRYIAPLLKRGLKQLPWFKNLDHVPAETPQNAGAKRGTDIVRRDHPDFEPTPAELGSPEGRRIETAAAKHPEFEDAARTQHEMRVDMVDDSIVRTAGTEAGSDTVGQVALDALDSARKAEKEALNTAYWKALAEEHGDDVVKSQAVQDAREGLREVLESHGLIMYDDAGRAMTVDRAGFPLKADGNVAKPGALDVDVANQLISIYNDAWLNAPKVSYRMLDTLRQTVGGILDNKKSAAFSDATEAALLRAYGALKGAQKKYLTKKGVKLLEKADERYQANLDDFKALRGVLQTEAQHIPQIFAKKSLTALESLERKMTTAGQRGQFDEMRRVFLRDLLEKATTQKLFEKALRALGPGVQKKYFSDALVDEMTDLAYLRDALKVIPRNVMAAGHGEGRVTTTAALKEADDIEEAIQIAAYNSGGAKKIVDAILADKLVDPLTKQRRLARLRSIVSRGPKTTMRAASQVSSEALEGGDYYFDEQGRLVVNIRPADEPSTFEKILDLAR